MRKKLIEILETVVSPKELLCDGEVLVSTARVADHLIANGVTIQKWIPVTDRLPEPWKWILCYCEAGCIEMLRYDDFIEEWGSVNLNRAFKKDYVTHWMPLPEPPKGE